MKKKQLKRANGTGTVKYLGANRRKPYAPVITVGSEYYVDENGNEKVKYHTEYLGYYATRQEAELALAMHVQDPTDPAYSKLTLRKLFDMFLEEKDGEITEKTVENYRSHFAHLYPIEGMKIGAIKEADVKRVYSRIDSQNLLFNVNRLLSQLCKYAIDKRILTKAPNEYIKVKKPEVQKERTIYTEDEIGALWELYYACDKSWRIRGAVRTTLIQIYTGMRIGEAIAVRKEDITEDGFIHVRGTKTKNADRMVPIRKEIECLLTFSEQGNLLQNRSGSQYETPQYIKGPHEVLMKKLGMKHDTHDARHTFISLADDSGINSTALKKMVGHASDGITEKVYTHKTKDMLKREINKISFV